MTINYQKLPLNRNGNFANITVAELNSYRDKERQKRDRSNKPAPVTSPGADSLAYSQATNLLDGVSFVVGVHEQQEPTTSPDIPADILAAIEIKTRTVSLKRRRMWRMRTLG